MLLFINPLSHHGSRFDPGEGADLTKLSFARTRRNMVFLNAGRRDCLEKMKRGAMVGGAIGGAACVVFGTYEAAQIRGIPISQKAGLVLRNSVGGSLLFGFFLAIGSGIRSCGSRERV
ncbi:unnamed protein product [Chondrus crispus]|uniref:Reactive oxygen species modulator 1 n=1 Tax=Chondrus crispus TaxID=2769 RepID=R7QGG0_CHOCR|nr:unnamed protein product [Chondrus crispus]CDF36475.1 unnamed protein product [Chondrus crispus]|eukprot:XP_005716294.1 unnamed protein product [Chondrus crispus]